MAREMLAILGNITPAAGVVVTKHGAGDGPAGALPVIEAGHPIPDAGSLRAGEAVCDALRACTPATLVIVCVSGGASALLAAPEPGISLRALMGVNDGLLRSGADIREINAVRRRIDRLKGGGLAALAQPARVIGLILSDVIGDPLEVIGSGLTVAPALASVRNILVGNNTQACAAAAAAAESLGYHTRIVTTELQGEAREAGARITSEIAQAPPGACLIYGGEPTVTLRGNGKGGRNQELALAAAFSLPAGCIIAALGTDGTDGPTDAAGAVANASTMARAQALGLDAAACLARNDSYNFFQPLGDLILTGPTGTNVADVVIALREYT